MTNIKPARRGVTPLIMPAGAWKRDAVLDKRDQNGNYPVYCSHCKKPVSIPLRPQDGDRVFRQHHCGDDRIPYIFVVDRPR